MMRKVVTILFFSGLLCGPPALGGNAKGDCANLFRAVEKKLGIRLRDLNRNSTQGVSEENVRIIVAVAEARLNLSAIPFRRVGAEEMRERGLRNYRPVITSDTPAVDRRPRYRTAMLLEVGPYPERPKFSGIFDPVRISHWMPEIQVDLKAIGSTIFIDPTLRGSNAGALFDPVTKAVFLDEEPIFADVLHEWGHAKFWHSDIPGFCRQYRRRIKTGQPTADLFSHPVYQQYGEKRLRHVATLLDAGFPTVAIDEHEAVHRVVRAVEKEGDENQIEIDRTKKYADSYLISEFAKRAALRPLRPKESELWLRYLRDDRFVEDIDEAGDDAHDLIYEYEALAREARNNP